MRAGRGTCVLGASLILWSCIAIRNDPVTPGTEALFIRGVTAIDVVTGVRKPATSVLVQGRRIAAVGPEGTIDVPEGAILVDGSGKYLIPGLIDSHVHLFMTWGSNWPDTVAELGWILASGVTTIRDAGGGGPRAKLQESYIGLRAAVRAGRIAGPEIVVSGSGNDLLRLTGASTLAEAFVRFEASGLDQYKLGSMPRAEARNQIQLARQHGVTVWGHHSSWLSEIERDEYGLAAVAAGVNGLAHRGGESDGTHSYPLSRGVRFDSPPAQRVAAALGELSVVDSAAQRIWIERLVSQGVWYEPTLAVSLTSPVLYGRCVPPVDFEAIRKYYPMRADPVVLPLTPAQADTVREICNQRFRFIRRFYEAGGSLVAGTDEVPFAPMGVPWTLSLFVRTGLPPIAALQAATVNSAKALNIEDRVGTIEPGKEADLLLLNGDPLEDIQNVRRIYALIANGRLIDREALLARDGTNPPMRSGGVNAGIDRISPSAAALARTRPDSILELRVLVNELYRPEDFAGVPRWVPAELRGQAADTLLVRGPASIIGFLAGLRFVRDVVVP